jgi:hypothetical protein
MEVFAKGLGLPGQALDGLFHAVGRLLVGESALAQLGQKRHGGTAIVGLLAERLVDAAGRAPYGRDVCAEMPAA